MKYVIFDFTGRPQKRMGSALHIGQNEFLPNNGINLTGISLRSIPVRLIPLLGGKKRHEIFWGSKMTHTSSFDITTAGDFFRTIVIPQHEDFVANNSSSRHALLTTVVAYHMYEWVHRKTFTVSDFKSTYPQYPSLADVFELARNITNGTKHFKPKAKTRTQKGFSSGFSDAFARPLMVEFPDGSEKSADRFLCEMVDFWGEQQKKGAF